MQHCRRNILANQKLYGTVLLPKQNQACQQLRWKVLTGYYNINLS